MRRTDQPSRSTRCRMVWVHFNDREIVGLTSAIVAINAWNRWAISMRTEPGTYRPDLAK